MRLSQNTGRCCCHLLWVMFAACLVSGCSKRPAPPPGKVVKLSELIEVDHDFADRADVQIERPSFVVTRFLNRIWVQRGDWLEDVTQWYWEGAGGAFPGFPVVNSYRIWGRKDMILRFLSAASQHICETEPTALIDVARRKRGASDDPVLKAARHGTTGAGTSQPSQPMVYVTMSLVIGPDGAASLSLHCASLSFDEQRGLYSLSPGTDELRDEVGSLCRAAFAKSHFSIELKSRAWKEVLDDPFPALSRFRGKANRKLRTSMGKLIGTGFDGIERLKPGRHKYMFEKFIAADIGPVAWASGGDWSDIPGLGPIIEYRVADAIISIK